MSVSQILGNALSQINASQEALRVTSNNIANVNTPHYAREVAMFEPQTIFGLGAGVEVAEVQRVVDRFLSQQFLSTQSDAEYYEAKVSIHEQLQVFFGEPDSDVSLPGQISKLFQEISDLTLNPSSSVARDSALGALNALFQSIEQISGRALDVQSEVNRQIEGEVKTANLLLDQIYTLNKDIARQTTLGQSPVALLDQRDALISDLSEIFDLRVNPQPDGTVNLMTASGFELLGTLKTELSFDGGVVAPGAAQPQIMVERKNPSTGLVVKSGDVLDFHLRGGKVRGLLDMRDTELPALVSELGNLAALVADSLNAVHNNNSTVPAPNALTGYNTGLLGTDAHNFSGQTTLVVTDANGALVSRIDLDFDANTYSVDGGGAVAFGGTTISAAVNSINTALGGNGSASFSGGVLSLQASPATAGLSFLDDATNPSDRAGRSFSHFFGLNDLITGSAPTFFDKGVSAGGAHGFTPGETVDFVVRGSNGKTLLDRTFTIGAGATFTDLINDLNTVGTGLGEVFNFSLSSNGALVATPLSGYSGAKIYIGDDTTDRGGTGVSLGDFFGLSGHSKVEQALHFDVDPAIEADRNKLALAKLDLSTSTVGTTVLAIGDNRGALDFEAVANRSFSIPKAGHLPGQTSTIDEYAATILSALSLRADQMGYAHEISTNLHEEVDVRKQEVQGVNLDEELSNMIIFQQSYNAGARLITAAQELLDTLLNAI